MIDLIRVRLKENFGYKHKTKSKGGGGGIPKNKKVSKKSLDTAALMGLRSAANLYMSSDMIPGRGTKS